MDFIGASGSASRSVIEQAQDYIEVQDFFVNNEFNCVIFWQSRETVNSDFLFPFNEMYLDSSNSSSFLQNAKNNI